MANAPCTVMILAAGRGERMRPLTDRTPKPLLEVGGKALIVWQIEALVRAGFTDMVINVALHGERFVAALGNGARFGAQIQWSREQGPLETAGGVATASPLIPDGPVLIVSADIWTHYDYSTLAPRARAMTENPASPRVHLVMVPNPPYHPQGDFALRDGMITLDDGPRLVYGNIGLHDSALFRELPRGVPLKMLPLWRDWIAQGVVSGERYDGPWANLGTPADLADLDRQLSRNPQSADEERAAPPTHAVMSSKPSGI